MSGDKKSLNLLTLKYQVEYQLALDMLQLAEHTLLEANMKVTDTAQLNLATAMINARALSRLR